MIVPVLSGFNLDTNKSPLQRGQQLKAWEDQQIPPYSTTSRTLASMGSPQCQTCGNWELAQELEVLLLWTPSPYSQGKQCRHLYIQHHVLEDRDKLNQIESTSELLISPPLACSSLPSQFLLKHGTHWNAILWIETSKVSLEWPGMYQNVHFERSPPFSKDCSVMSGKYLEKHNYASLLLILCHEKVQSENSRGWCFAGSVSSFSRKTPSSVIFASPSGKFCKDFCRTQEKHQAAETRKDQERLYGFVWKCWVNIPNEIAI